MPIHLFEGNSAKEWFSSIRKFDHPDLTGTPLDLDLCDTKYSIVMLATIRCKYSNVTKLLKLQTLKKINGKS